ncbi:Xaa-Pro aminopeptidase [Denitromonas iodatirespirans]|uniref:Xaa-Pro aminopeptidase n=1 Tax=Denitromonas iodatirespirans TaxID=2795389 RepID=A0A944HB50_DENI1|nr:Xaa-Pro aminopeptidase [Denitromonas iodatirespirans]MBT0961297.1 Xaa-Pro aminopeptidase [Denitromonas iodatirespirans]
MNPAFAPFHNRRQRLLDTLATRGGGVAIVPTAAEVTRNRDTHYPFRPDSYFHYLSGFPEPEAVLVLIADDNPRSLLFCRSKDMAREIWDGFRHGPEAAAEQFGFDAAFAIGELDAQLGTLLANQPAVFFALGHDAAWDTRLVALLNQVREQVRTGITAPTSIQDLHAVLDEMRLIKDSHEVLTMRRAAAITDVAHRRAMQTTRPGLHEYAVEAELLHAFRQGGAQSPAYPSIVASGPNACVLHYVSNDRRMADGDLLLIDAGCELDGYASDVTRTFPVNGRFSGPQRDVYQLVLAAQQAAIDATAPGVGWNEPHDRAVAVLVQGMLDLGLLRGSLDGLLESGDYRRFYMHRTGHWLGLDVHDAGDYKRNGDWRPLQEGMTLTVEPGCYIRPADDIPEAFWHIGIRIEDDALVTAGGCDILTANTPKTIDDIEALMRDARP